MGIQDSITFKNPPVITSFSSIVGQFEKNSPLRDYFDFIMGDALWGEDTWEKTERKMFKYVVEFAINKMNLKSSDIDVLLGGDLLNQIISASFSARDLGICFLGQYGACSNMAQSLIVGSILIDSGHFNHIACATSSHFPTAERQYRVPLELGCQRPPTAQRTVSGAGCSVLSKEGKGPKVTMATIGRVIDWGVSDANNMGAAMAPSTVDTLTRHFTNTNTRPNDYDLIITGDLGFLGKKICCDLINENGYTLGDNYTDCGCEIFTPDMDVDSGGSGCGCSASVFNSYVLKEMENGKWEKVLFVATGALLSPTSTLQNESIPGVAHAVVIENI